MKTHPFFLSLALAGITCLVAWSLAWLGPVAIIIGAGLVSGVGGWFIARLVATRFSREHNGVLEQIASSLRPSGREHLDRATLQSILDQIEGVRQDLSQHREVFNTLNAVALVLRQNRIVLCNETAAAFLGIKAPSLVGRDLLTLFTEADLQTLCEQASCGESVTMNIRFTRPRVGGIYACAASPITLADGIGVFLVMRDVTELAQASALKTDFVGNASHELRTPIAAIRGAVDTLSGPARDDAPMRERLIDMIREHVVRLEELVRDLLDLSRFESPEFRGEMAKVDLYELCAEVESLIANQRNERKVDVRFEIDDRLGHIRTNPRTLVLILRNLLDNAIKFSHEQGVVRLVGTRDESDPPQAVFEIIDAGIGIPLAQQQRIFERFYQVDQARSGGQARRGSGLGLAIVKHAVRRLGGTIEVQSVWNEGTTMRVSIPLDLDVMEVSTSEPPHHPESA